LESGVSITDGLRATFLLSLPFLLTRNDDDGAATDMLQKLGCIGLWMHTLLVAVYAVLVHAAGICVTCC
jgi:hypothetical protein